MARLFFALWPAASTRDALVRIQQAVPVKRARPVPAENLHLTLLFLGSVDQPTRDRLEGAADALSLASFELELNRLGWWPRSRVVWIAPSTLPEALLRLASELRRIAIELAIPVERRAFKPHLTLYRRAAAPRSLPEGQAVAWPARDFCLVRSVTETQGAHYEVLRQWALAR